MSQIINPERRDPSFLRSKADIGLSKVDNMSSLEILDVMIDQVKDQICRGDFYSFSFLKNNVQDQRLDMTMPICKFTEEGSYLDFSVGFLNPSGELFGISRIMVDHSMSKGAEIEIYPSGDFSGLYGKAYCRVYQKGSIAYLVLDFDSACLRSFEGSVAINIFRYPLFLESGKTRYGIELLSPTDTGNDLYTFGTPKPFPIAQADISVKRVISTSTNALSVYNNQSGDLITSGNVVESGDNAYDFPKINGVRFTGSRDITYQKFGDPEKRSTRDITICAKHEGPSKQDAGNHDWDVLTKEPAVGYNSKGTASSSYRTHKSNAGLCTLVDIPDADIPVNESAEAYLSAAINLVRNSSQENDEHVVSIGFLRRFVYYLEKALRPISIAPGESGGGEGEDGEEGGGESKPSISFSKTTVEIREIGTDGSIGNPLTNLSVSPDHNKYAEYLVKCDLGGASNAILSITSESNDVLLSVPKTMIPSTSTTTPPPNEDWTEYRSSREGIMVYSSNPTFRIRLKSANDIPISDLQGDNSDYTGFLTNLKVEENDELLSTFTVSVPQSTNSILFFESDGHDWVTPVRFIGLGVLSEGIEGFDYIEEFEDFFGRSSKTGMGSEDLGRVIHTKLFLPSTSNIKIDNSGHAFGLRGYSITPFTIDKVKDGANITLLIPKKAGEGITFVVAETNENEDTWTYKPDSGESLEDFSYKNITIDSDYPDKWRTSDYFLRYGFVLMFDVDKDNDSLSDLDDTGTNGEFGMIKLVPEEIGNSDDSYGTIELAQRGAVPQLKRMTEDETVFSEPVLFYPAPSTPRIQKKMASEVYWRVDFDKDISNVITEIDSSNGLYVINDEVTKDTGSKLKWESKTYTTRLDNITDKKMQTVTETGWFLELLDYTPTTDIKIGLKEPLDIYRESHGLYYPENLVSSSKEPILGSISGEPIYGYNTWLTQPSALQNKDFSTIIRNESSSIVTQINTAKAQSMTSPNGQYLANTGLISTHRFILHLYDARYLGSFISKNTWYFLEVIPGDDSSALAIREQKVLNSNGQYTYVSALDFWEMGYFSEETDVGEITFGNFHFKLNWDYLPPSIRKRGVVLNYTLNFSLYGGQTDKPSPLYINYKNNVKVYNLSINL